MSSGGTAMPAIHAAHSPANVEASGADSRRSRRPRAAIEAARRTPGGSLAPAAGGAVAAPSAAAPPLAGAAAGAGA